MDRTVEVLVAVHGVELQALTQTSVRTLRNQLNRILLRGEFPVESCRLQADK